MATIKTKANSPYWTAVVTGASGKRIYRSTGIPVDGGVVDGVTLTAKQAKARALIAAEMIESTLGGGGSVARKCKAAIDSLLPERARASAITTRKWCEMCLDKSKITTAKTTWSSYRTTSEVWLEWLGQRADDPMTSVSQDDALAFTLAQMARVRAGTVTRYLKVLRVFYNRAVEEERLDRSPFAKVAIPHQRREEERLTRDAFTTAELAALLAGITGEWRTAVLLSLYTGGQRLGDVVQLRWDAIAGDKIRVTTAKTGRKMIIPIVAPLAAHLAELPRDSADIMPKLAATYRRHHNISGQFTAILEGLGIDTAQPGDAAGDMSGSRRSMARLSFHSLRGTAVTLLHQAGVPAAVVQEIVGHSSCEVHRRYIKLGDSAISAALGTLPSF